MIKFHTPDEGYWERMARNQLEKIRDLNTKIESLEKEVDQMAIEFAGYMESESWEYDFGDQKDHTIKEHYAHFKAKYTGA